MLSLTPASRHPMDCVRIGRGMWPKYGQVRPTTAKDGQAQPRMAKDGQDGQGWPRMAKDGQGCQGWPAPSYTRIRRWSNVLRKTREAARKASGKRRKPAKIAAFFGFLRLGMVDRNR